MWCRQRYASISAPGRRVSSLLVVLTAVASTARAQDPSFFEPYVCSDLENWANWEVDKQTWCCAEKEEGCTHTYSCQDDANWQVDWSYGQKVHCCREEGKGCPEQASVPNAAAPLGAAIAAEMPPSTPAPIPFPVTSQQPYSPPFSSVPANPVAQTAPSSGCNAPCVVNGISHTCGERVLWSASHTFQLQTTACAMALELVQGQCSHCRACHVNTVGCHPADTVTTALSTVPPTTVPPTTPKPTTSKPVTESTTKSTTVAPVHTTQKPSPTTSRIAPAAPTEPPSLGLNKQQVMQEAEKIAAVLKEEKAKMQRQEQQKEMALAAKEAALDDMVTEMKAKQKEIEEETARIAEQSKMLRDAQAEAAFHAQQMAGVGTTEPASSTAEPAPSAPRAHEEEPASSAAEHASAHREHEESSSGPPFKCDSDSLDEMDAWKEDRKVWCCRHKDRACDLIGSNTEAKKTQNSATPYHCQGKKAGPIDEWSDVKLDWCCSIHTVACDVHRHRESSKHSRSSEEKDHHEKKEHEQPHHKKGKGFFDGYWSDKRGNSLIISDGTISWPETERSAEITKQSEKAVTMAFAGGEYHAKYIDAKLVWDVDDVWKRSKGHSEEHHSKEAPKENHKEDDFQAKVRTVLSTIDRNDDGHLDFTEITSLQTAANVGHIHRHTYEQLCKEFGEDPSVGLGVETLSSIYAKTGSLPGTDSSGVHAVKKFLNGQLTPSSAASASAPLFACAVSCVALALAGTSLVSRAARSNRRALQVNKPEEDDAEAQHSVTYRVVPRSSSPSSALLANDFPEGL